MKSLEIRRHSMRKDGGGSQLSQEGVRYARRIGETIGPFARVITTVVPRTRETAIAMGFAVDYELVTLSNDEELYREVEQSRWWEETTPFAALAGLPAQRGPTWRHAHAVAAMWRDAVIGLPDGSAALFVGHSGDLEMGLVACFPDANHRAWGAPFGLCEGARLEFSTFFADMRLLREGDV